MAQIETVKVWFEVDTTSFSIVCGYYKAPGIGNVYPVFSKEVAIKIAPEIVARYHLKEDDLRIIIQAIQDSPLPARAQKMDHELQELCVENRSGKAPELDVLGYVEALKRKVAVKKNKKDKNSLGVFCLVYDSFFDPSGDVTLAVVESMPLPCCFFTKDFYRTQPFFSKKFGYKCLKSIAKLADFTESMIKTMSSIIDSMDDLPEEPVVHDYATARYYNLCLKYKRDMVCYDDYYYRLIRLGIFVDIFGDEGEPA